MALYIILTVAFGVAFGHFYLPASAAPFIDRFVTCALVVMVFGVGMDIGRNREVWRSIRQMGGKILLVPLAIAVGSLLGACMVKLLVYMPLKEILAVSAGLGWYSLSGILIADLYSVELGATAFLSNVFRELLAFILIPILVGYVGKLAAIAPGGATTMDSTLPLITKVTDAETALVAFMSGLVLTTIVPFLVPFLLTL
jgi:uncharacterized membrane protein YbjE (DUF340 family)